jgi:hypothetical protein
MGLRRRRHVFANACSRRAGRKNRRASFATEYRFIFESRLCFIEPFRRRQWTTSSRTVARTSNSKRSFA